MAAFSSSGFSTDAFSSSAFDFSSTPVVMVETKGGFDERDYHHYRKHLEELERVTRTKDVTRIREIAEEIDLDLETPELDKLSLQPETKGQLKLRTIDYDALEKEIDLIREYLNTINILKLLEQELDDEAAFLLMIQ